MAANYCRSEKNTLTEEAQNIIKTIKQMEASLDDEKDRGYDLNTDGLRVTFPLNQCLRDLKEKYNTVGRLHRERFEQVKKLVQALESYSSHLESSFVKIRLPPTSANTCPPNFDLSPSYVTTLDEEFTRVYDEYNKRISLVQATGEEIVRLWSELGIPQAQTDSSIVSFYRDSPEQLGLHQADIERLRSRRDKLVDEKKGREKRLKEMRNTIEGLWDRLGVEEPDRKVFLASNRGCGLRTINEFEDELARLNELKRQNLHLFVEDARVRLQELWDSLYFSEEEMLDFTPAFSDVYSDALLSAHEAEIERLTTLQEQRAPVLAMIEKHRSIIADRESLAATANDASRLMMKPQKGEKRDPGKLLREEKMRKRIAKELPKVTAELTKVLENYEEEFGRPFLVHGERYLDEVEIVDVKPPPARSKTPNGLPPRSKTPSSAPAPKSAPASTTKTVPLARPGSVMRGPAPPKSTSRTPTRYQPASRQQPPTSAAPPTASRTGSPSKIPSRAPLGTLRNGGHNSSPERRTAQQAPQTTSQPQHNYAQSAATMGPPRAPPPRMRDLFPEHEQQAPPPQHHPTGVNPPQRPASVVSSTDSSSSGSRYVRPMSPEDVYTDHERMSYMSTSMLNRDHQQMNQSQQYHPAHQPQEMLHSSLQQRPTAPPSIASRQTSNTSSNLTTASTAPSGSENWETYEDESEIDDRHAGGGHYGKIDGRMMGTAGGQARAFAYGQQPQSYAAHGGQQPGLMAPPPAPKMRYPPLSQQHEKIYGREQPQILDENGMGVGMGMRIGSGEGSEAAWSTEEEGVY